MHACDWTRRCTDTLRESALKVDFGRRISCLTGESNLPQRRAGLPTQLSYIPGPKLSNSSLFFSSSKSLRSIKVDSGEGNSHKATDYAAGIAVGALCILTPFSSDPTMGCGVQATEKRRKLAWFGHVTRHESLSKTYHAGHPEGWATLRSVEKSWKF